MVVTEIEACKFRGLREDPQWDLSDLVVLNTERLQEGGREGERRQFGINPTNQPCRDSQRTHVDSLEEVGIGNGEGGEPISAQLDGGNFGDGPK